MVILRLVNGKLNFRTVDDLDLLAAWMTNSSRGIKIPFELVKIRIIGSSIFGRSLQMEYRLGNVTKQGGGVKVRHKFMRHIDFGTI